MFDTMVLLTCNYDLALKANMQAPGEDIVAALLLAPVNLLMHSTELSYG